MFLIDPAHEPASRSVDRRRIYLALAGRRVRAGARYVLYWTQICRRPRHNFALSYAIERANELGLPIVVYEGLRFDYPWANDRLHTFILQGARESAAEFARRRIRHVFFLERGTAQKRRAVAEAAGGAALVVTDYFPCYIVPGQTRSAAEQLSVPLYAVDSCGVVPLAQFEKEEYAARTLRPKIRAALPEHLRPIQDPRPEYQEKDPGLKLTWDQDLLSRDPLELARECDIDHSVAPVDGVAGGFRTAAKVLERFVARKLAGYASDRNHPDRDGTSGLSPYLHFGHLSPTDVALAARDAPGISSESRDAFLEELIVRRELSYNFTRNNPRYGTLDALPAWAQRNLELHKQDEREHLYTLAELEAAATHDEVWNAAQRQLLREGTIHNYLRMLWGKKVIEWTRTHEEAFRILVHLNNKYALDGRDPNSWTGILWCFGKHDRAWQSTPVLGSFRPMSTKNARRKLELEAYLDRFGEHSTAR